MTHTKQELQTIFDEGIRAFKDAILLTERSKVFDRLIEDGCDPIDPYSYLEYLRRGEVPDLSTFVGTQPVAEAEGKFIVAAIQEVAKPMRKWALLLGDQEFAYTLDEAIQSEIPYEVWYVAHGPTMEAYHKELLDKAP